MYMKRTPKKSELLALTMSKLISGLPSREVNSPEEFTAYLEELASRPPEVFQAEVKKALSEAKEQLDSCTYLY